MNITESTEQDIQQLTEWIQNDPYHKDCLNPTWWLTGNGLLSYCLTDSKGPTMFVRTDQENELLRLHVQFAPESEVSKLRTIKSMTWAMPVMEYFAKQNKLKGMIYKSVSPSLISFMQIKFGFTPLGHDDDYVVEFSEEQA